MTGDWADNPQPERSVTDYSDPVYLQQSQSDAKSLLLAAARRLESVENLLLNPMPHHIQEAEQLFELAAEDLQALQTSGPNAWPAADEFRAEALALQATLRRVLALLNGALRVHWHRLRRMGSYLETYTAAGAKKVCVPYFPRLDLKM
jgi:hypothetical protein